MKIKGIIVASEKWDPTGATDRAEQVPEPQRKARRLVRRYSLPLDLAACS